jgi:hypothetical protein
MGSGALARTHTNRYIRRCLDGRQCASKPSRMRCFGCVRNCEHRSGLPCWTPPASKDAGNALKACG